jgi:hypothetical protein
LCAFLTRKLFVILTQQVPQHVGVLLFRLPAYFLFRGRDLFERGFEFEPACRAGLAALDLSKGPNMIRMELCEAWWERGSKCISKDPEK